MAAAVAAYDKMAAEYFKDLSAGELALGLNVFYEEDLNRSISINDAVWLVAHLIAGKTDAEMRPVVDSFRKNAK